MKQRAAYLAVLASVLGIVAFTSMPAQAVSGFRVSVDRARLDSGQVLTVRARSAVVCDWGLTFDGQARLGRHTTSFVTRFVAPVVARTTTFRVGAICVEDGAGLRTTTSTARSSSTIAAVIPRHWIGGVRVTVDPPGTVVSAPGGGHHPGQGGAGGLPNTGGPRWWLLLLGLACTLTGSVAVGASRRRPVSA